MNWFLRSEGAVPIFTRRAMNNYGDLLRKEREVVYPLPGYWGVCLTVRGAEQCIHRRRYGVQRAPYGLLAAPYPLHRFTDHPVDFGPVGHIDRKPLARPVNPHKGLVGVRRFPEGVRGQFLGNRLGLGRAEPP